MSCGSMTAWKGKVGEGKREAERGRTFPFAAYRAMLEAGTRRVVT